MKLSLRMHNVIWGPYMNPIDRENEEHEWLREVCKLEAKLDKAVDILERIEYVDYPPFNPNSLISAIQREAKFVLMDIKNG